MEIYEWTRDSIKLASSTSMAEFGRANLLQQHENKKLINTLFGRSNDHLLIRESYTTEDEDEIQLEKKKEELSKKRKFDFNNEGFGANEIFEKFAVPIWCEEEEEGLEEARDKMLNEFEKRSKWIHQLYDELGPARAEAEIQKALEADTKAAVRRSKANSLAQAMAKAKATRFHRRTRNADNKIPRKIRRKCVAKASGRRFTVRNF